MSTTSLTATPPRAIPGSVKAEQATENESGCLLNSVSESLCHALYQSLQSSVSASLKSTTVVLSDRADHPHEDATKYAKDSAPSSSNDSKRDDRLVAANGEEGIQHTNTTDEDLTTPQQAEQTDSDTETMEMVITDDYCSKSLIGDYLNIKMKTIFIKVDQELQADDLSDPESKGACVKTTRSPCEEEEPLTVFQMDDDDLEIEPENRDFVADSAKMPKLFSERSKETGCVTEKVKHETNDLDDERLKIERVPQDSSKSRSASESSDTSSAASDKSSRKEIYVNIKRDKLCSSISGCLSQTEYKSSKFTIAGIKGTCTFHAQGLDQDLEDHYGTVTAVFDFPKDPKSGSVLHEPDCKFKLSVSVYEGPVEKNQLIGENSSCRTPTDEDKRQNRKLHMTVHRVVNLCDIIFSDLCPSKINIKIVAEISI